VRLWDAATGAPRGAPMKHDDTVLGAVFDKAEARILSWSSDKTVRLWDVLRLGPGHHVEVACRLLPDKNIATLRDDFGINVADGICTNDGKDAPAPDFRDLKD
jgi:hypothetical protein